MKEKEKPRKAVIMGATSGIGRRVAELLIGEGWSLAVCGRNTRAIDELAGLAPERVRGYEIDVTQADAEARLERAMAEMESDGRGVDVYLHVAGVGSQNRGLEGTIEERTVMTNAWGWTRMVGVAYRHFAERGSGHIAVISSIAGTRGLGAAPSYSATKAFQNTYIEALAQLARMEGKKICFTDIRPGFVRTPLLGENPRYPMLMDVDDTARRVVAAVKRRREVAVIDWRWRIVTALWRLIPHRIWRRLRIG